MAPVEVWHDGGWPICHREIALIRRLDSRSAIDFIHAAHSDDFPMNRADILARFHARNDGELLSGAAAFAAMWRVITLLRPIGLAACNAPVLATLARVYLRVLRARPSLQRLASLMEL